MSNPNITVEARFDEFFVIMIQPKKGMEEYSKGMKCIFSYGACEEAAAAAVEALGGTVMLLAATAEEIETALLIESERGCAPWGYPN